MGQRHKLLLVLCVTAGAALALVAVIGGGSSGGTGDSTQQATSAATSTSSTGFDGALLPRETRARGFTLTDQHGRQVSLSSFRGRITVLAFLDCASQTTAPLIAQQIRGALDELESHPSTPPPPAVPVLAVSVAPASDTPACVRTFLRRASLTGRVDYLTGTPGDLRAIWKAYTVVPASAGEAAYERSAFVLLLDRAGAKRVELPLEELTPEGLAHDVRRLWRESAAARPMQSRPGTPDILPTR